MKKSLSLYAASVLLAFTMVNASNSQHLHSAAAGDYIAGITEFTDSSSLIRANEVNTRVVRDFTRRYEGISDAKWFKLKEGFVVYFTQNETRMRVVYDKRGTPLWTIRSYFEDKLPLEIRHIIRSTYYDFSIYHIDEITMNEKTVYLVKMEDKTSWLTIRVTDGEMEVAEIYKKG